MTQKLFGLYIHWPFCLSKCPYCDFNSHVRDSIDEGKWREALLKELDYTAQRIPGRTLSTVFFGGGTPSLMSPKTVGALLDRLGHYWQIDPELEVTLEANPNSVEADKFQNFKAAGINRLSLGIQSLRQKDLKFLGRSHSLEEALKAIHTAQKIFPRFSFDLIYARPEQRLDEWQRELTEALEYAQGHLSLYQLTIEAGTAFHTLHERKAFRLPQPELASDFYALTQEMTEKHGVNNYEVSNYARPGEECRHNLIYWKYGDFAAIGPGAHGRLTLDHKKISLKNLKAPETWINAVEKQGHGSDAEEILSPKECVVEALIMGMRLKEGIEFSVLERESPGCSSILKNHSNTQRLREEGYLEFDEHTLRTTFEGRLRLNSVIDYLTDSLE